MKEIDIVGAGIGGLTLALALERKGYRPRIFEQAENLEAVGAGIILGNNAMQIFSKLGLKASLEESGNRITRMCITRADLKPLSVVSLAAFERQYEVPTIAVHRGLLQKILIEGLEKTEIQTKKQLVSLSSGKETELSFSDGSSAKSMALVGADGIHSQVRQNLIPNAKIRFARQYCWRGVTDYELPEKFAEELNEAWAPEGRFGFVQLSPGRVYWYALVSSTDEIDTDIVAHARFFESFHPLVKELIDATPDGAVHATGISDLKPLKIWTKENICLLGDAAHATTPNMGQGACQAIEDAWVLSEMLEKYPVQEAFVRYQQIRMAKAHWVVRRSWSIGKMAHVKSPFIARLRNLAMQFTPNSIARAPFARVYRLPSLNS